MRHGCLSVGGEEGEEGEEGKEREGEGRRGKERERRRRERMTAPLKMLVKQRILPYASRTAWPEHDQEHARQSDGAADGIADVWACAIEEIAPACVNARSHGSVWGPHCGAWGGTARSSGPSATHAYHANDRPMKKPP